MASTQRPKSQQPLALEMLEADHRKVEMLFDQFEEEKDGDEDARRAIAERICAELTVHARVEEECFYPWLRDHLEDDALDMVEEAYVEHATAKDLIAQIQGAGEADAAWEAKVKVLSEYIRHHVQEEENEIFQEVRDQQEELDELGQEMHARKAELMEEMGLMEAEAGDAMQAEDSRRGHSRESGASRSR